MSLAVRNAYFPDHVSIKIACIFTIHLQTTIYSIVVIHKVTFFWLGSVSCFQELRHPPNIEGDEGLLDSILSMHRP